LLSSDSNTKTLHNLHTLSHMPICSRLIHWHWSEMLIATCKGPSLKTWS
jgi:hypothetical protein